MLNKLFLSKIHVNRFRIKSTIGIQHLPNMYRMYTEIQRHSVHIQSVRVPSMVYGILYYIYASIWIWIRWYRSESTKVQHTVSSMCFARRLANNRAARAVVNQRKVG